MKTLTKLSLAVMMAAGSTAALADDDQLRKELADAKAEVAQLKAQLAQSQHLQQDADGKYVENAANNTVSATHLNTQNTAHVSTQDTAQVNTQDATHVQAQTVETPNATVSTDNTVVSTGVAQSGTVAHDNTNSTENLNKAIFVPSNLNNFKIDRDEDDNTVSISGDLDGGNVRSLAIQARQALTDSDFTKVRENIDDDDAKLVYEKVTGDVRETVEVEIDESWLTDNIDYDVEYEKHSAEITAVRNERRAAYAQTPEYQQQTANLPAGIFIPSALHDVDVDRDADDNNIDISGEIDGGSVQELAQQARQALIDAGYKVVKENIDDGDDAKLVYEKVNGQIRETIEVEIDESWLTDNIDYDVEYEKHY